MPEWLIALKEKPEETKRVTANTFGEACKVAGWDPMDCQGGEVAEQASSLRSGPTTDQIGTNGGRGGPSQSQKGQGPTAGKPRKPRADKGIPRKGKAVELAPSPKQRRSRAKPNIRPEYQGDFYQSPEGGLFILACVEPEPTARMIPVDKSETAMETHLSHFKDWVRLVPERKR